MSPLLDAFPLSRKQVRSIVESQHHRFSLWSGAVRSGKTIASIVAFLLTISNAPNRGLIIITGRTLSTIYRNIIEPMQDPDLFGELAYQVHHTRGTTTATILGRTVHLIGAADARAENKLRGLTAYCIYADEMTLLPEEFVTQALARLSMEDSRLLGTTNPGGPKHWLRQRYILRKGEIDFGHWHFTLDDNHHLPRSYVEALKAEMTGVFYARNIDGKWVAAEGAVYDMWDEDRHVWRGPPPPLALLPGVGIDYGTANPTSAVMLALTQPFERSGPKLLLTREWRHDPAVQLRQLTDSQFSAEIRKWIGSDIPEWVCVDPSAASLKLQLFQDGLTQVVDADNAVMDGIRTVGSLLATDRLLVHESCRGVIDEMGGYSWDPKAAERGDDRPLKVDDHSVDSLRYSVHTTQQLWRHAIPSTAAPAAAA